MLNVEVLVLKSAMPSGVTITFDMLETVNRWQRLRGQPPTFAMRSAGSGAGAYRALFATTAAYGSEPADIVVVPGLGLSNEEALKEGLASRGAEQARRRLREAAQRGASIAASCSATFLVASAGLLDGRRATTTWWLAPIFRRLFPAVDLDADALVVADDAIITAGAAMAQMDLMLALIARHAGAETADACARYMLLDGRRSQAPYAALGHLAATDERIARAEAWARAHLEAGIDVEQLADAAGLTPRTFARRLERVTGLSPVRFLQRLRLERATELVRSTRLSVEEIARRVGYAEPSTLRRLLRREGRNARSLRAESARRASVRLNS